MENENIKKGKKYILIGVLVLFLAILGSSVAYYLARVQGSLSGRAAGTGLSLTIDMVSDTDGDLIPLDNDVETLNQAILGYGNTSNSFDSAKACLDINNYSVCQVYKVTLTNNGSVPVVVNSKVELSGANTPNIDCTKMDDEKSVSNSNSCKGNNTLANNETINGGSHKDYYVVVYIKNLDVPQEDKGEFNGTITFTSTQGDQVKGRFKQGETLVDHITKLYSDNKDNRVTNNNIEYQYATSVNLMNDRLGGTTALLDDGNIRYYGSTPDNYIDIGDKYETDVTQRNWETIFSQYGMSAGNREECLATFGITNESTSEEIEAADAQVSQISSYSTLSELCSTITISAGTPILWRIIGVFDGKLRIRRDESIGVFSYDTSSTDINDGNGINEWSQSDLMKLLNPGYDNESIGGSLWWDSKSGSCYNSKDNVTTQCDFTNTGLSDGAKEHVIDQTIFLGGFNTSEVFVNEAWVNERGANVFNNTKSCYGQSDCNDNVTRTTSWSGKVGLIYSSDFGYAADLSNVNCQSVLNSFSNCTVNWMNGVLWTISPRTENAYNELGVYSGYFDYGSAANGYGFGVFPTLTLDPSLLFDDTTDGSLEHPYKIVD